MSRTCGDCNYYAIDAKDISRGSCRHNLPSLVSAQTPQGTHFYGQWPPVQGKFKACRHHRTEEEHESRLAMEVEK